MPQAERCRLLERGLVESGALRGLLMKTGKVAPLDESSATAGMHLPRRTGSLVVLKDYNEYIALLTLQCNRAEILEEARLPGCDCFVRRSPSSPDRNDLFAEKPAFYRERGSFHLAAVPQRALPYDERSPAD